MKLTPIVESMDDTTMLEAMARNDAIEAIREGCSREDYVRMHKPRCQAAAAGWYDAVRAGDRC